MSNNLLAAGSQPTRPMRFAPLHTNRFFTGLWTQRNPLRDAATPFFQEKFYSGSRFESLIDGLNVELTAKLTLQRRPGCSAYTSTSFHPISRFYTFHTQGLDGPGTLAYLVLADVPADNNVYCISQNPDSQIVTDKINPSTPAFFQEVGNTVYISSNQQNVQFNVPAWQPGYAYNLGDMVVDGSALATAHVQIVTVAGGASGSAFPSWNHAGGNTADGAVTWHDNGTARMHPFARHLWGELSALQPAFMTPDTGVTFWQPSTVFATGFVAILDNNGNIQYVSGWAGSNRTGNVYPKFNYTLGGYTRDGADTTTNYVQWTCAGPALGWAPATAFGFNQAIIDSNGNIQVVTAGGGAAVTGGAAPVWATVRGNNTVDNAITWTCCGAGHVQARVGYRYAYAYHTTSKHVGTASNQNDVTAFTGPILGTKLSNVVHLVYGTDTACDFVYIFRTVDGGSTLFFLDQVANSVGGGAFTYTDSKQDYQLNLLLQAPVDHNNDRPPVNLTALTYHLSRIWGAVGSAVYYTRTADATAGNPLESWPPGNVFVFPAPVMRLHPNALGLVVFTQNGIFLIGGAGTINDPLYSRPLLEGIGLLSYDAFAVNGTIIYMMTADSQVVELHLEAGVAEIGFPIGDQLASFSPTASYLAWHIAGSADKALYVTDGSTSWFRMNPVPSPETGICWSPKATIVGGVGALASVDTSPGIKTMLIGPASGTGKVLKRNTSAFQDNGSSYSAFVTLGNLVLALPGQLAALGFIAIECTNVGSAPSVDVLLDEISGSFATLTDSVSEPPEFPSSSSLLAARYYFSQAAVPAWCRHLQIKFSWPSENAGNELLTYTLWGAHYQEN